jgi:hypothetical protein
VARLRATHRSRGRLSGAQLGLTRSDRYGITASIAWAHTSWCVFWPMLWKTLAAGRQGGLGDKPRKKFEELCEISLVDVILPTRNGVEVRKRCISQPTEHQRILLHRLGMKLPMALEQIQM